MGPIGRSCGNPNLRFEYACLGTGDHGTGWEGRGGGKVVRFCKGGKETDDECEVF